MLRKLSGMSGLAVRSDVGGRRASGEVEKSHAARDQARIIDLSDPQRTVDPLGNQVEMPLIAGKRQLNVRILSEEARQGRDNDGTGNECWRVDADFSLWSGRTLRQRLLSIQHLRENALGTCVVGGA